MAQAVVPMIVLSNWRFLLIDVIFESHDELFKIDVARCRFKPPLKFFELYLQDRERGLLKDVACTYLAGHRGERCCFLAQDLFEFLPVH